jgi:ribosomal protein S18 acetylase RimI-like enzyme
VNDGQVHVRPGTIEDYPGAYEVIAETFAFHQQAAPEFFRQTDAPPPTRAWIEQLLQDGQRVWYVAETVQERESRIVGFITARLQLAAPEPFLTPEVRVHVDTLGILPAWQRRGIARRLMEAVESWARQRGARRITLSVWEFNRGALGLYDDLGYATFRRDLWKAL